MLPVPPFSGKIVHFYVDKAEGWDYCKRTFEIVESLREKYGIESKRLDSGDPNAYWKALKEVWGEGRLVTIEQDIVFTEEQLLELLRCKRWDCTFAYRLYPASTALPFIVWSIGENLLPHRIRLYREDEKVKFCNFSATGFLKLCKKTQLKVPLEKPTHWKTVDMAIMSSLRDPKIHVHYEVEHAHK